MLYKFCITQWKHPAVGDWTLTAKLDLADLGIQEDLNWIKLQSVYTLKN